MPIGQCFGRGLGWVHSCAFELHQGASRLACTQHSRWLITPQAMHMVYLTWGALHSQQINIIIINIIISCQRVPAQVCPASSFMPPCQMATSAMSVVSQMTCSMMHRTSTSTSILWMFPLTACISVILILQLTAHINQSHLSLSTVGMRSQIPALDSH